MRRPAGGKGTHQGVSCLILNLKQKDQPLVCIRGRSGCPEDCGQEEAALGFPGATRQSSGLELLPLAPPAASLSYCPVTRRAGIVGIRCLQPAGG